MDVSVYAFWKIINYVQQFNNSFIFLYINKTWNGAGMGHAFSLSLSLRGGYDNVFISDVWVLDLHFEFILS